MFPQDATVMAPVCSAASMHKGLSLIIPQGHGKSEGKLFLASPPLGFIALNKDRHRISTRSKQAFVAGLCSCQLSTRHARGCPGLALQPGRCPSTHDSPLLLCHSKTPFPRPHNVWLKHFASIALAWLPSCCAVVGSLVCTYDAKAIQVRI